MGKIPPTSVLDMALKPFEGETLVLELLEYFFIAITPGLIWRSACNIYNNIMVLVSDYHYSLTIWSWVAVPVKVLFMSQVELF